MENFELVFLAATFAFTLWMAVTTTVTNSGLLTIIYKVFPAVLAIAAVFLMLNKIGFIIQV